MVRVICLGLVLLATAPAVAIEFKDGDRVVLIGSTLIEREQRYGYWEAAITAANPDKTITFRNLGWSGDTVWGEARAGFGTPADGYKHLVDHVRAEKPTVIIVGYGTNESFAGPEGLPKFREQLKKLLDDLATTKARFMLLPPMKMEQLPAPMPDVTKANENFVIYGNAIREEAWRRKAEFIDIMLRAPVGLTENGQHLTARGYWATARWLLDPPGPDRNDLYNETIKVSGSKPIKLPPRSGLPLAFEGQLLDERTTIRLEIANLPEADHSLRVDGKVIVTASAKAWAAGKEVPNFDTTQAEQLRQTIIAKNELYFHRWRPQNVTYLFGFRKYEQGNNAREIPQFDPLVEAKEKEIAKLRKPREHVYELVPVKK